eukprot:365333-Chlamydomonas_euryale.AAC.24
MGKEWGGGRPSQLASSSQTDEGGRPAAFAQLGAAARNTRTHVHMHVQRAPEGWRRKEGRAAVLNLRRRTLCGLWLRSEAASSRAERAAGTPWRSARARRPRVSIVSRSPLSEHGAAARGTCGRSRTNARGSSGPILASASWIAAAWSPPSRRQLRLVVSPIRAHRGGPLTAVPPAGIRVGRAPQPRLRFVGLTCRRPRRGTRSPLHPQLKKSPLCCWGVAPLFPSTGLLIIGTKSGDGV